MLQKIMASLALAGFLGAGLVQSEPLAKAYFGHIQNPNAGAPQSIGSYAKGCMSGAAQLPETGPTWQAMRLSRNRNYGHPVLIDFIEDLSRFAATQPGWAGLYVGDMSQPRGGPMLTGHASHQIGLDVDIWALPPKRLNLSRGERESLSSVSMVTDDLKAISGNFNQGHINILAQAARDPRVARIFVTPAAKLQICAVTTGNPDWLGKIRPWWGHDYHFHVRLKCQPGSSGCVNQDPVPRGDGCNYAREFYGMYIAKTIPVPPSPPSPPSPPLTLGRLPAQCAALVK